MAKLCPAGKAAAKKKFAVYPSAYANIWASKYCKGKVGRTKKAAVEFVEQLQKVKETLMERIHEWVKKMIRRQMGG